LKHYKFKDNPAEIPIKFDIYIYIYIYKEMKKNSFFVFIYGIELMFQEDELLYVVVTTIANRL
jgi:hypothetical protein